MPAVFGDLCRGQVLDEDRDHRGGFAAVISDPCSVVSFRIGRDGVRWDSGRARGGVRWVVSGREERFLGLGYFPCLRAGLGYNRALTLPVRIRMDTVVMDGRYAPEQERYAREREACGQNAWAWVWVLVDWLIVRAVDDENGFRGLGPETHEVVEIGQGGLAVVVRFCMGTGTTEAGTWPEVGGCGGLLTVGCLLRA